MIEKLLAPLRVYLWVSLSAVLTIHFAGWLILFFDESARADSDTSGLPYFGVAWSKTDGIHFRRHVCRCAHAEETNR